MTKSRRVFRKQVKPGKGGKCKADGSSHRDSFYVESAIDSLSDDNTAQSISEDGWEEDCWEASRNMASIVEIQDGEVASLHRLDVSRKQRQAEKQHWRRETGRYVGDDHRSDYLRAVIAPLNWQQDMLLKREEVQCSTRSS